MKHLPLTDLKLCFPKLYTRAHGAAGCEPVAERARGFDHIGHNTANKKDYQVMIPEVT